MLVMEQEFVGPKNVRVFTIGKGLDRTDLDKPKRAKPYPDRPNHA